MMLATASNNNEKERERNEMETFGLYCKPKSTLVFPEYVYIHAIAL